MFKVAITTISAAIIIGCSTGQQSHPTVYASTDSSAVTDSQQMPDLDISVDSVTLLDAICIPVILPDLYKADKPPVQYPPDQPNPPTCE